MTAKTTFNLMAQEADEIVYRIAFACEWKDKDNDVIVLEDKDVVYVLCDFFVDKLKTIAKEVKFYLSTTERTNFRYNTAKTPGPNGLGYKAGRGDKPYHYYTVRNFFIKYYGAEEIKGYEADDALGMSNADILSHIDKDINMLPRAHYNYVNDEIYEVPEGLGTLELSKDRKKLIGKGLYQFYAQLLTGDRTDNIPGIKGCGPVKVHQALQGLDEQQCVQAVKQLYLFQYGAIKWVGILLEIADLIWICRDTEMKGSDYLISKGVLQ
jgi:hypothetical protein